MNLYFLITDPFKMLNNVFLTDFVTSFHVLKYIQADLLISLKHSEPQVLSI